MEKGRLIEMLAIAKRLPETQRKYFRDFIEFLIENESSLDKFSLRDLRNTNGLSQKDLAELAGISATKIIRAERGLASPEIEKRLRRILTVATFEHDRLMTRLFTEADKFKK